MKKIKEFIKTLFDIITLPSMMHLPGNLAFFIILSIFPVLILIGILASYFSISIDGVARAISIVLPNGVEQLLLPYIHAGTFTRNIIISTIFFSVNNLGYRINSFNKNLSRASYMSDTILGAQNISVNKRGMIPAPVLELIF